MAVDVINNVVQGKISIQELTTWIVGKKTVDCPLLLKCNREDFVPYFLNFLREQTSRVLKESGPRNRAPLFPSNSDADSGVTLLDHDAKFKAKPADEQVIIRRGILSPPGKPLAQSSPIHTSESSGRRMNLSLQDFIVQGGRPQRKKSPSRKRINPTRIETKIKGFGSALQCEQSFLFCEQPVESHSSKDFEEERTMLRKERARQLFDTRPVSASSAKIVTSCIEPDIQSVTCPERLDVLVDVYCYLLDNRLVLNVMSELCFVMGLLVMQTPGQTVDSQYFSSLNNCVYFAASVLNRQRNLLKLLDRVTLKMLAENERISSFIPDLHAFITELLSSSVWKVRKKVLSSLPSKEAVNVSFQSDTDNRQNFPSDQAFHVFRKQRDGLYDILRIWEANHLSPGWSFGVALGQRIRILLSLHVEPANFMHFARLFRLQLLGSTKQTDSSLGTATEIDILKEVPLDKLNRLRERLVAPIQSSGPTKSMFPGRQEFYKDFILHSQNPTFIEHLSDSLIAEICLLNNTDFTASDLEDTDTSVDDTTCSSYLTCVTALRVLAKFLGFITFLPYQTKLKCLPENIVAVQSDIRSKTQPKLDVLSHVRAAIDEHKLVLTVPWVVEYLCFMDPVIAHLSYYRDLLMTLFQVYHDSTPPGYATLLITLTLGWLFELPNFPAGLFYVWLPQHETKCDESGECSRGELPLDFLDVVDEHCLYICCPNMGELKLSLSLGLGPSGRAVKHITPVSASIEFSQSSAAKQLELHLEESFFHAQPASTRKTVEFVGERVTSCCVKHICNTLLPVVKHEGSEEVRRLAAEMINTDDNSEVEHIKELLTQHAVEIASKCCNNLKQRCDINNYCKKRTKEIIPLLLADDVLSPVSDACVQIANRQSRERVNSWINSHITPGLFVKDFQLDIDKAFKRTSNNRNERFSHLVPIENRCVLHRDTSESPTQAIMKLRLLIWRLLDGEGDTIRNEEILAALRCVKQVPEHRADLIFSAQRLLPTLVTELALLVVTYRPDLMNSSMMEQFVLVWGRYEECTNLVCPRNVLLLSQSKHKPSEVWTCLARLLVCLLTTDVLSPEALEQQFVSLLRTTWPQVILDSFSTCIQEILNSYHSGNCKFTLLMEWLCEVCDEMDQID